MLLRRGSSYSSSTHLPRSESALSETNLNSPRLATPASPIKETLYGEHSIDSGDEVRFNIELCRLKNLPGLYILTVKRLKGNHWSFKFIYQTIIEYVIHLVNLSVHFADSIVAVARLLPINTLSNPPARTFLLIIQLHISFNLYIIITLHMSIIATLLVLIRCPCTSHSLTFFQNHFISSFSFRLVTPHCVYDSDCITSTVYTTRL